MRIDRQRKTTALYPVLQAFLCFQQPARARRLIVRQRQVGALAAAAILPPLDHELRDNVGSMMQRGVIVDARFLSTGRLGKVLGGIKMRHRILFEAHAVFPFVSVRPSVRLNDELGIFTRIIQPIPNEVSV